MGKRTAFISGATSGIGASFAKYFAQEGYDLILTGHPNDSVDPAIIKLKETNHIEINLIMADLSDEAMIEKLEKILKEDASIEVLVNNAGYLNGIPFLKNNVSELEKVITVHINCLVRFVHATLPNMMKKERGVIIGLSSLAAYTPFPEYAIYPSSKLFITAFFESLHISFRKKGIKFQVLCPGFVRTNFHNRAGIDVNGFKNNRFLPWMTPDEVVESSVRNLKKSKLLVIPGRVNRIARRISLLLPRKLYYWIASRFLD